jgi:hypothetical protein
MDKLANSEDVKRFLLSLGLHVDQGVVEQVVNILSGQADRSLYSLYATRPDKPLPVCGKGTAYKIKELYDKGELEPYLAYLSRGPTLGGVKSEQAEREAPTEDDIAKISGVGKEEAKPSKIAGGASLPESKRPLQEFLEEKGVLALAATVKDDLSKIDALDDAVFQLLGAPWLLYDRPEAESVLHVLHGPKLRVVLVIERNQPSQFLLLAEQLEPISPGFLEKFRQWERQSLTPFIGKCQEKVRAIWYEAEERTRLKMLADQGYGLLQNVPIFVYSFALEHCAESNPPEPGLDVSQADISRFPYLQPYYRQLTPRDNPNLLLAAGSGQTQVYDRSSNQLIGVMDVVDACRVITVELCQQYAQDDAVREIVEEEKALKSQIEPFREALSDFLRSFTDVQEAKWNTDSLR